MLELMLGLIQIDIIPYLFTFFEEFFEETKKQNNPDNLIHDRPLSTKNPQEGQ